MTGVAKPATLADVTLSALDAGQAVRRLLLPRDVLRGFLEEIEAGYDQRVPYHNAEHVKTVVQAASAVWHDHGLRDVVACLSPNDVDVEELALMVAAAVHDHQHPGFTNDFLIRTLHPYALAHK